MSYYCKIKVLDSKFRWDSLSKVKEFQSKFEPKDGPRLGLPGDLIHTLINGSTANFELVGIGSFYCYVKQEESISKAKLFWVKDPEWISKDYNGYVHDSGINHMIPNHGSVRDFFASIAEYFDFTLFVTGENYLEEGLEQSRNGVKPGYYDEYQTAVMWLVEAKGGVLKTFNVDFKIGSEIKTFSDD